MRSRRHLVLDDLPVVTIGDLHLRLNDTRKGVIRSKGVIISYKWDTEANPPYLVLSANGHSPTPVRLFSRRALRGRSWYMVSDDAEGTPARRIYLTPDGFQTSSLRWFGLSE